MKNYKYLFIQLILCCLVFTGCDNYLDITPKGKKLLSSVDDYDQWLNNSELGMGDGGSYGMITFMGDNVDIISIKTPPVDQAELIYTWSPQFSFDLKAAPIFWGENYSNINLFNTVLVGIDKATGGSASKKRSLKAEALLGRALQYFNLVNEYAKPYDPATADQDLAVPFVTSNDVTQVVPPRSTTAEIYKHIIDDVATAIPDLPADNSANRFRGSVAAGYSLLARVYFYQRNYTEARKYAELALTSTKAVMINFNGTFPSTNLLSIRPDVIYGRMVAGYAPATLDFMRSFASNDLRPRNLYLSSDGYNYTTRGATSFYPAYIKPVMTYVNTGTSVQEMLLIAAEGAARSNDLTAALDYLNEVRKNRFATATYTRYESSDQNNVLKAVLEERYHELGFNGLRWFDMRRLDMEGRMETVNRYNAQGDIVATLTPHSEKYTLQIPSSVMSFNPEM